MSRIHAMVIIGLLLVSGMSFSATWVVNGTSPACTPHIGGGYNDTIQDGIDSASAGDTVIVCQNGSGVYTENVVVGTSINLTGNESNVRVEADNRSRAVIKVNADWVNITNFHVYGANGTTIPSSPERYFTCGIFVNQSENIWIENVTSGDNNGSGILLYQSNYSRIINNTAYGTGWPGDSAAGFLALNSSYNIFENNTARENQVHGFNMNDNCTHNNFTNNYATRNLAGMSTYQSSHNRYEHNVFENNTLLEFAIKEHSNNNTVVNNTAFNGGGDGFQFENSTNTTFIDNTIYSCDDKGFVAIDGEFLFFNDNVFYDLDMGPNIGNITFLEFKNNLIYDIHGMAGLAIFTNSEPLVIENLTLHSCFNGIGIGLPSGIGPSWAVTPPENITINNSRIYNNTNVGIMIYSANRLNIMNTELYNHTRHIYMDHTNFTNITNNSITNPSSSFNFWDRYFGIMMNRSYEVVVEDNTFEYLYLSILTFGRWNENVTIERNNMTYTGGIFSSCGLSGTIVCPDPGLGKESLMNANITHNRLINSSGITLDHRDSTVSENINISDNLLIGPPGLQSIFQLISIWLHNTGETIVSNNNITDYYLGMITESIDDSTNITYNNITDCTVGMFMEPDEKGILYMSNNTMENNHYHFGIYEDTDLEEYYQNITTSNTVDGKPMYYYIENETTDGTFDNTQPIPADAGWVGIINSSDMLIENFTFMHNLQGMLVLESRNITVNNVTSRINYWSMTLGVIDSNLSNIIVESPEIPALAPFGSSFNSYGVITSPDDNNFTNFAVYSQPHIYIIVIGNDINGTANGLKLGFNQNYGIIEYNGNINESWIAVADGDTAYIPVTLSKNAAFGEDFVSINSSSIWTHNLFDGPATVTLRGACPVNYYRSSNELPMSSQEIIGTGDMFTPATSRCTGNTAVFEVEGFSGYTTMFAGGDDGDKDKTLDLSYERLECPEDGVLLNATHSGEIINDVKFRVLRNGMIYYEMESYGEVYLYLPKEGYYYVEADRGGYKKDSISFNYELCEVEEPEPEPEKECTVDSDCLTTHYCNTTTSTCRPVTGECGFAENHTWHEYECCVHEDCVLKYDEGYYCVEHVCVLYELVVPELVYVGDKATIRALVDGEPLVDSTVSITGPEGESFEAVTDEFGEIVYTPKNAGEHDIGLIEDEAEVTTAILNAKMRDRPPPEPEPEPIVEEEFPWCWLLLLLLVILLAAYYYYTKKEGMDFKGKKKK